MSNLLNNDSPLSLTEKQAMAKKRMVNQMRQLWSQMKTQYEQLFNQLWHNPQGLTPQQVFDSFGTESVEFFTLGLGLYQFMNTLVPGTIELDAPYPYEIQPDGSIVVIVDTPSESSVSQESVPEGSEGSEPSSQSAE